MSEKTDEDELNAIEERARAALAAGSYVREEWLHANARTDIPALLAEVRRLRALVVCDCCGRERVCSCPVCDNDE